MKKTTILVSALLPFFLTSCLSEVGGIMCALLPDSDHCFQWSGSQGNDPSKCEKIKGEKFKDIGSNPPKDKCYLQIAENTGNYDICKKIVGGMMSYTIQECLLSTAIKHNDAAGCKQLKPYPSEYGICKQNLVSLTAVEKVEKEVDDLVDKLKKDPKNDKLKEDLKNAKNRKNDTYNELSEAEKGQYFKDKREKITGDIEDEDVKKAIGDTYVKFRTDNPGLSADQLLDKMKTIKEEQVQIKRLDDYSNELTDKMKEQISGIVDGKKDELIDGAKQKAKDYLEKNGGANLKYGLKNLEWMRDKYEKGSEQYNKLQSKYDKLKGTYDEIMGVYNKVDEINSLVANGKITEGQASAIKGGVFLQKGLEYTTKYVPVFGSTISTISKETFEMVTRKAKERAIRTNSMNKCIDDPEHCDLSTISAY